MHIIESRKPFDAIVVGSGATGGWAAKVLCEGGLNVLLVEAGKEVKPGAEPLSSTALRQGAKDAVQSRCSAYNRYTSYYFIDDEENPYTTPVNRPFSWIRSQVVGGRTLLWAGQSYRMSDYDFKAARFDHSGEEWPISYDEIAPYYGRAEKAMAVRGTYENLPQLPDGALLPTAAPDANALYLRHAFAKRQQSLIPARLSSPPSGQHGFCIHCNRSNSGCLIPMSSPSSTLAAAHRTGRLTLLSNTLARHLVTDKEGKAIGIYAINKDTRQESEVYGRMIFLCASTLESTRIMLNSVSRLNPAGFGNSSGALGHYLMDHLSGVAITASFRDAEPTRQAEEKRPVQLMYIPRRQNLGADQSQKFLRGYGYQVTVLKASRFASNIGPTCGEASPADKARLKASAFLDGKVVVRLQAFGEMLPRFENYVEIDKSGKQDALGIPVLSIHCEHGENEREMAKDMAADAHDLVDAAGAITVSFQKTLQEPGLCIHEAGTCRMGNDPKTSVLNRYNQCHDAPNVFVTDGSCFTSQGTQNPTLTMMALTIRAAEYALQQARKNRKYR